MPIARWNLEAAGAGRLRSWPSHLLSDELWGPHIEPVLAPLEPHAPRAGKPRLDDRKALTGILFVLKTGIPWEDLPW